jgi:SAM-dependent methyltransferase
LEYRFAASEPREHFASGRVLYNARGAAPFPVRLADEIAQRCFHALEERGCVGPYAVYDPCCGSGYLLTVIGLLHGPRIRAVLASDIDASMLEIARRNLSLLTEAGMRARTEQLRELYAQFGKPSHREALESAAILEGYRARGPIEAIEVFQADITAGAPDFFREGGFGPADIVIADLPYGQLTGWRSGSADPAGMTLDSLLPCLKPGASVVALIADKSLKPRHERYRRVALLKAGKRQISLLEPIQARGTPGCARRLQ